MFSIDISELQHCLGIDELARTNAQLALEQARSSLVYESVTRSFNIVTSRHQFSVINGASGEIDIL
jgi:hypothetical protein